MYWHDAASTLGLGLGLVWVWVLAERLHLCRD